MVVFFGLVFGCFGGFFGGVDLFWGLVLGGVLGGRIGQEQYSQSWEDESTRGLYCRRPQGYGGIKEKTPEGGGEIYITSSDKDAK